MFLVILLCVFGLFIYSYSGSSSLGNRNFGTFQIFFSAGAYLDSLCELAVTANVASRARATATATYLIVKTSEHVVFVLVSARLSSGLLEELWCSLFLVNPME